MLADLVTLLIGIAVLVVGGDVMVRGAASLARRLGVSPLAIGLTVVAFGTSAPELAVNLTAAIRGDPELSFGNIFGSNMANIGLIIATAALVRPLNIHNVVIRREMPMMMLATAVAAALGLDGILSGEESRFGRGDGIALLLLFTVFIYYTLNDVIGQREAHRTERRESAARREAALANGEEPGPIATMAEQEDGTRIYSVPASFVLTVAGLVALAVGARFTVHGATDLARAFGVSEAIIGLTLVAIGTSLPELVASIAATVKGHSDLAIGNAVGSNVFNLLLVLGLSAMVAPIPIPRGGVVDILVVGLLSVLLWLASASANRKIIRTEAVTLLAVYLVYITYRSFA